MQEQIARNEASVPSPFRLLILEDTPTDAELNSSRCAEPDCSLPHRSSLPKQIFSRRSPRSDLTSSSSIIAYPDLVASRPHA